jgi:hypothetical protein
MAIINPLTYTISNGDPVDATPVQANFTQIVQDVNANAASVDGDPSQQFLVATTSNPAGAVPLAQAQQQFAALNGSASNQFAVANATAASQAVNWAQAGTQVLAPATSAAITPVAFSTLVLPGFSAAGTITVNPGSFTGQRVRVYGCAYTVTVQTNVSSGFPALFFPDGSSSYAWNNYGTNQAIEMVWDGVNWRSTTVGQVVAAAASASNQVVTLGQANGLYAPVAGNAAQTFAVANASASNQAVNLGQLQSAGVNTAGHLTNVQLTAPNRALSTTYYNTTGYTMWVWVTCQTYNSAAVYSVVNGYTINNGVAPNGSDVSAFFVVPNGGSYQVYIGQSNNGSISSWVEWY